VKPPPITILPDPEPVATLPLEWTVINDQNPPPEGETFYALTEEGYEAAALNLASFTRWAREMRDLMAFYVRNIERQQETNTDDKKDTTVKN